MIEQGNHRSAEYPKFLPMQVKTKRKKLKLLSPKNLNLSLQNVKAPISAPYAYPKKSPSIIKGFPSPNSVLVIICTSQNNCGVLLINSVTWTDSNPILIDT